MVQDTHQHSFSILRNFIRHATSIIVYHRLKKESICQSQQSSMEQNTSPCFVDRDFCGMNLKYMDPVTDDGNVTDLDGELKKNIVFQK